MSSLLGYSFVSFAMITLRNPCSVSAFSLYKYRVNICLKLFMLFEKTWYVLKIHTLCIVCTW